MRRTLPWILGVLVCCCTIELRADDAPPAPLPKSGSWARYHVSVTAGGQDISGKFTLKVLGEEQVNGADCRWVEFKSSVQVEGREEAGVSKILLPSKRLLSGDDPASHVARGWMQQNKDEPRAFPSEPIVTALLALFLPGRAGGLQDVKALESERTVDCQQGRLVCKGTTGTREVQIQTTKIKLTETFWLNEKVPFGAAAFEIAAEVNEAAVAKAQLTLEEIGAGAESDLPNQQ